MVGMRFENAPQDGWQPPVAFMQSTGIKEEGVIQI